MSFTADDGPRLARLAGEAEAGRRGGALRAGYRPVHTTGVFMRGTFEANGAAGPSAPDFLRSTSAQPVVARFSGCSTLTDGDDRRFGPRGLAVRFQPASAGSSDLVAMSTDCFPVATLDAFYSAAAAMSSRVPMRYIRLFLLGLIRQSRSPMTFMTAFPPPGYNRLDYYPVHTFIWTGGAASEPVRYRWRTADGVARTGPWSWLWARLFRKRDYLTTALGKNSLHFVLEVQRAADIPAARLSDVGRPLPRTVRWEEVGSLQLDAVVADEDRVEVDGWLFSPAHLPEGVEPYPGDEIFLARCAAYPASHVIRVGGKS